MPALLALIPEIVDALAAFIGATWWQLPAFITLWKVQDAASQSPSPGQPSPIQAVVGGAGSAGAGAGAAVGGAGQALGAIGQFIGQNPVVAIGGGIALLVLLRR